jgi:hypothetical protein
MEVALLGSDNLSVMLFFGAVTDANSGVVQGQILIDSGPCSGQSAPGSLSRP